MRTNQDVCIIKEGKWYIVSANNRQNYVYKNEQEAINKYLELKNSITL